MPHMDEHYYVSGYSVENDPYVMPNGVLVNLLGLNATADLNLAEAELVPLRTLQLWESPLPGQFDLAHLQAIHQHLFQDIYPWAGRIRQVDIAKNETVFLPHGQIVAEAGALFGANAMDLANPDLGSRELCERLAVVLGRLNYIHPFREGNGRSQRELLNVMIRSRGYWFDWSGHSPQAMKQACVAAIAGDFGPMIRMLRVAMVEL